MGSLLEPLSGIIDSAFVARLGADSLAALAVGVTIINSFSWVFNFLTHVIVESVSSTTVGEENSSEQGHTIRLSMVTSAFIGLVTAIFLFGARELLYDLAGASGPIVSLVDAYFLIRIFGQPFSLLLTTQLSVIRGLGHVNFSMLVMLFNLLLNILLTYCLIFVVNFGVKGAAIGTISSHIVTALICFIYIRRKVELTPQTDTEVSVKGLLKSLSKKSLNLFVRSSLLTTVFFLSTRVAAHVGVNDLAGYHLALQFWLFASFFTDGVAMSANIYGARLKKLGNWGLFVTLWKNTVIISLIIGSIFTFVYGVFGKELMYLFTKDQVIHELISGYWWVISFGQIINALAFSYDGMMFGVGGFHHLRNLMVLGFLFVYGPFAYVAYSGRDVSMIWVGLLLLSLWRLVYIQFVMKKAFFESPKMS